MVLRYTSFILVAVLFYFLSFGPVWRYVWTRRTTTTKSGTTIVTIGLPPGVGIFYFPAFKLRDAGGSDGVYAQYLDWWMNVGR